MFSNESEREAIGVLLWYETGSAALAEELQVLEEGAKGVLVGTPAEPHEEIELEGVWGLTPGSHSWTVAAARCPGRRRRWRQAKRLPPPSEGTIAADPPPPPMQRTET